MNVKHPVFVYRPDFTSSNTEIFIIFWRMTYFHFVLSCIFYRVTRNQNERMSEIMAYYQNFNGKRCNNPCLFFQNQSNGENNLEQSNCSSQTSSTEEADCCFSCESNSNGGCGGSCSSNCSSGCKCECNCECDCNCNNDNSCERSCLNQCRCQYEQRVHCIEHEYKRRLACLQNKYECCLAQAQCEYEQCKVCCKCNPSCACSGGRGGRRSGGLFF